MSAEKKPEKPAEVPPFLQSKPGQTRDGNPKPAANPEPAPEIPYFLRAGASAVPAEPKAPRPKSPAPSASPPTKAPGLLHSLVNKISPAPPRPAAAPPAPTPERPAPAFLR